MLLSIASTQNSLQENFCTMLQTVCALLTYTLLTVSSPKFSHLRGKNVAAVLCYTKWNCTCRLQQSFQFQYKEILICFFSTSWWAIRTTEDLFSFPLADCPTNFAHSWPWRQILIVFWCFFQPITVLTVWQPKHIFVFSFFPCTPSTQSNRHTNFHRTGECF